MQLVGGPCDGITSLASHDTAFHEGEAYVYDGGENPDRFVHVDSTLAALPAEQRAEERRRVADWMDAMGQPMAVLIGIPPWRINAWVVAIRNDINV